MLRPMIVTSSIIGALASSYASNCLNLEKAQAELLVDLLNDSKKEEVPIVTYLYNTPFREHRETPIRKVRKKKLKNANGEKVYQVTINDDVLVNPAALYLKKDLGSSSKDYSLLSEQIEGCESSYPSQINLSKVEDYTEAAKKIFVSKEGFDAKRECEQGLVKNAINLFGEQLKKERNMTLPFLEEDISGLKIDRESETIDLGFGFVQDRAFTDYELNTHVTKGNIGAPGRIIVGTETTSKIHTKIVGKTEKEDARYNELGIKIKPAVPGTPGKKVRELQIRVDLGYVRLYNDSSDKLIHGSYRPHVSWCEKSIIIEEKILPGESVKGPKSSRQR